MKLLLNRQAEGWLMLDPESNRSLGLFDSEEEALERAWKIAMSDGIDAVVYSRDSMDDDSIIVVSGLKRCADCGAMRPAEDFYTDDKGTVASPNCGACRDEGSSWPRSVILDGAEDLIGLKAN